MISEPLFSALRAGPVSARDFELNLITAVLAVSTYERVPDIFVHIGDSPKSDLSALYTDSKT
jgi:hypothetical protein